MTRLQRGWLGGKGGCQPNKAVVVSADWGTVAEASFFFHLSSGGWGKINL